MLVRKSYKGCDYCCSSDECGIFDGTVFLPEELHELCDEELERAVENGRLEYREAWWSYISEYADY